MGMTSKQRRTDRLGQLKRHRRALLRCRACPGVSPPVVTGPALLSRVYLLGQAPGPHEGRLGRPFAYTAGKNLFRWFSTLGVDEELFRERVYMAAVLRCFPGKGNSGGDRVPGRSEIDSCSRWISAEQRILQPELVIAVGRLAIEQVGGARLKGLESVVGGVRRGEFWGRDIEWVALPHPSGLNTWYKVEPGKNLLRRALVALGRHPVWKRTFSR
jgi:uracil-DNA glycosylase